MDISTVVFYNLFTHPDFADDISFFFYILLRVTGVFVISPLLSNKAITTTVRFFLGVFIAIILAITLYPQYLGDSPRYVLPQVQVAGTSYLAFAFLGVKEIAVGYLIGFCFNIFFELLALAGEAIDTIIGFATPQFFDPISNMFQSLLGQLLVMWGTMFMLAIDFHHVFVRILALSLNIVPIGLYQYHNILIDDFAYGTSLLFVYALKIATIPLVLLALSLVPIAFTVRVVPEMNLLLTGLPMRVLVGYYTLMLAIAHMPYIFEKALYHFAEVVQLIVYHLGGQYLDFHF